MSVELKQSYELNWSDRYGEFLAGNVVNSHGGPEDDSEITCECGWSGRFDALKPVTEKYRVVLIMDINAFDENREPISQWDWKDKLDLYPHESVTVDGVNKL